MMKERIWGVLVGGALGDAMGMPTECWSQEKIFRLYPEGIKELLPSDEHDAFGRKMVAGEVTDDTINTVMIYEMIVANNGQINAQAYVNQLLKWNNESGVSAYVSGPSTLKALEKIAKGMPLTETGIAGTTNGASMRIAPVGIISDYRQLEQLVERVYQICLPTHNTKIAIAGASAVAAAVSYVVRGGTSMTELWQLAYDTLAVAEAYGYDFPAASLRFRMRQAQRILAEETDQRTILARLYEEVGSGVETIETIPCVFAIVQMAQGDPLKTAQLSASLGWDTDTIGAISSSICGGMNPNFSAETVTQLEAVNQLNFKEMAAKLLPYCS
ncbi:ADP-ribosylglycohydrolase family protein [Enterococcus canis]|uniref:ADP-ribosylglycohydrolase family protein n=1 Tax=Enterococcus canis TaxID=214095 RepID=A0A1L8RKS8_9ENTE|nr:ADP-ribosylglycohydrolase family protein [Enterococcus canis]OJG20324.1 ADP-ribosylglycohydrolase family protein [Enterococcus canis]